MVKDGDITLTKIVIGLIGTLILALLGWVGYTLNTKIPEVLSDIKIQQAKTDSKIDYLTEKSQNIVPRSENERRYENLEKGMAQNAERISKLEQYLLNRPKQ